MLGLVGTNGIGKSTALKVLAGKLKPNLGRFDVSYLACTSPVLNLRLSAANSLVRCMLLAEVCSALSKKASGMGQGKAAPRLQGLDA